MTGGTQRRLRPYDVAFTTSVVYEVDPDCIAPPALRLTALVLDLVARDLGEGARPTATRWFAEVSQLARWGLSGRTVAVIGAESIKRIAEADGEMLGGFVHRVTGEIWLTEMGPGPLIRTVAHECFHRLAWSRRAAREQRSKVGLVDEEVGATDYGVTFHEHLLAGLSAPSRAALT